MREKLYSKGPWVIEHSFNVKGHGRDGVFRIVAGCGGYSTNMSDPTPENIANTNLVSAAPDLLEALERVYDACGMNTKQSMAEQTKSFKMMRMAISKAYGETI